MKTVIFPLIRKTLINSSTWLKILSLTVKILTKFSFPILTSSSPSTVVSFIWMVIENTEWERLQKKPVSDIPLKPNV